MKKIFLAVIATLLLSCIAQSQMKLNISLTNPGVVSDYFKFDVSATIYPGQIWRIGSSNIRVDFSTNPGQCLTINPYSGNIPFCPNYTITTTSISNGTAVSFNIIPSVVYCTLTTGTYKLGEIRFLFSDSTCCTTDHIRITSVLQDSMTVLTYGVNWTKTDPDSCVRIYPVGINNQNINLPVAYKLYNGYPNPFNPKTTIKYDIPKSSFVKMVIYDVQGKEVETLINKRQNPGSFEVQWDASNYASGIYICKIEAGSFTDTKKLVLIK